MTVTRHDDDSKRSIGRRHFLKGAAAGAASALATNSAVAQQATPAANRSNVTRPTEADARADFVPPEPIPGAPLIETPGSDHMLDIFKLMNFDYVAVNPGSSFEGIHESIINHGGNRKPEILTVLHEEAGAAMSHGYAKAAGKPMMTLMHGTVGLLHASMGLFQAWADRVPVYAVVAHAKNPTGTVNRPHSAQDMGAIVRDFMKMDEEPSDIEHFAESALRLYTIGRAPPMGPTLLTVSSELQESAIPDPSKLRVPTSITMPTPPQGDSNAVREAARLLAQAQRPLIRLGKLGRTSAGWDLAIELAELLQAPVDVGTYGSWQDFPSWHRLYGNGGADYKADVVLGLELNDMASSVRAMRAAGGKVISICSEYFSQGHNIHDFAGYQEVDIAIAGDGEATLPILIEEIRKASGNATRMRTARGEQVAAAHKIIRAQELDTARYGWNSNPVSVPRMISELARQVQNDDWAIVSGHQFTGTWQRRLMNFDKHYRYNGDCGGFGIGYDTPASVGGALAHREHGRLPIAIVGDGDFNFVGAGALWTAAHHKIPLLLVIHNNRAYHAEVMLVQRVASRRGRGTGQIDIGNVIRDPAPDYAMIAKGYGIYSEGPISDPNMLAPAFERALARVRAGEPALVDVISQPR
jgi:acetolactate synthase-1/2/3 large subunit